MIRRPPRSTRTDTPFPYTTLFRSSEPQGLRRVVTGYSSAGLDLRRSPEALLAGLHGKWRAALRKAEREGIAVDRDTKPRQQQASLLLYDTFRRKKRFVGPFGDSIAAVATTARDVLLPPSARSGNPLLPGERKA